jgi:hypothetical protein
LPLKIVSTQTPREGNNNDHHAVEMKEEEEEEEEEMGPYEIFEIHRKEWVVSYGKIGWMFRGAQVQRLMNAQNCACYNSEASIHVLKASYVYTVATTDSWRLFKALSGRLSIN